MSTSSLLPAERQAERHLRQALHYLDEAGRDHAAALVSHALELLGGEVSPLASGEER